MSACEGRYAAATSECRDQREALDKVMRALRVRFRVRVRVRVRVGLGLGLGLGSG